jgi:hypothetical protein
LIEEGNMPEDTSEYAPDLGTNPATVQMYDKHFEGPSGALFKTRVADAAKEVGLNPGLLAANLLAEHTTTKSYTKRTGEVEGWTIGTDYYKDRKAAIERVVPAARKIKPIRYEPHTNELNQFIPEVPVFKAEDAVLASAVYLKYAEEEVRRIMSSMGGSLERLPVEYQFALTRYALNAGVGRLQLRVMEFLGMTRRHGHYVQNRTSKEFIQYKPWKLRHGLEQFSRHKPQRAATAHTAQAIHISQKIFGIIPTGGRDSLLFIR